MLATVEPGAIDVNIRFGFWLQGLRGISSGWSPTTSWPRCGSAYLLMLLSFWA